MEFEELERLEPWGPWRDNWHAAMIAHILANVNRGKNKPPVRMHEFMYKDPETAREQEDQEMLARLRVLKKKDG
jgi:hypothetical protein